MSETQLHDTVGAPTRRRFMRGVAAVGGAAAVGASLDPVDRSQAITPSAFGPLGDLARHGVSIGLGWALREYTVLGANSPADGLSASALIEDVYQDARTRQSTNLSTLMDNLNILNGIENNFWIDGKLAAFEALNAEKSKSEVTADAHAAVEDYASVVEKNLLKTWNEALSELENIFTALENHSDAAISDVFHHYTLYGGSQYDYDWVSDQSELATASTVTNETTVTLSDGSEFTVNNLMVEGDVDDQVYAEWNPSEYIEGPGFNSGNRDLSGLWVFAPDESIPSTIDVDSNDLEELDPTTFRDSTTYDGAYYLDYGEWNNIWSQIQTHVTDAKDGLSLWIDNVYSNVQSGEVEISDLITARERAAMMTDDGKYPQAVADLVALNIPVDLEREATVSLDYLNEDVTLQGSLGITSPPETLESGVQYDPEADNLGTVYLTYDVGSGVGVWTGYDSSSGVDGGTVTFTSEPLEGVTYAVTTNYDETAEVTASDFTEGDDGSGNTIWTADVSGQLDNSIAEIESVEFYTPTDETRYETIQIRGAFTIEKFMNRETGEEETSATFESSEPQNDTNYVTQEEWDSWEQRTKELIESYEESQNDDTSGGGGSSDDGPSILDQSYYGIPALGWVGGGLVTLAAIASRGN